MAWGSVGRSGASINASKRGGKMIHQMDGSGSKLGKIRYSIRRQGDPTDHS